jgi:thiamine pyrophosphate-dependent acetolactate synthase large subunit-like protein
MPTTTTTDSTTAPNGGALVAQALAREGVTALFTLCGGHIAPILIGCKRLGIKVVDVRHEVNAVFAADAAARLTGIPGVAAVTAGPGVTNTITAIKNAQMAQSPLVLLGGATATVLRGRGSLQDIDQMALIKPHVKATFRIRRVRDIPEALREAFAVAAAKNAGVPGPVFVELPIDALFPQALIREWYGIKSSGASDRESDSSAQPTTKRSSVLHGIQQRLTQWYLNWHLNNLFGGGWEEWLEASASKQAANGHARESGVPQSGVPQSGVEQVLMRLAAAERPVMVLGSQVLLNPHGAAQLRSAIEALGIPVYLSGMARGLMAASSVQNNLQMRHKRSEALREADVVLLAGVPCDFRLDYGNHIGRSAQLISVNRSEEDLKKNRTPDIALLGDPMDFLVRLGAAWQQQEQQQGQRPQGESSSAASRFQHFTQRLRQRDDARNAEIAAQARQSYDTAAGSFLNPLALCQMIDEQLPPHSVIVADGGDFVATASYILHPRSPLAWYDPGVFGTLGVGAGFALGIKAVKPDAEVWIFYGDGSAGYSIAEFDTFARHKMGVVAVVGNDAGWTQIARDQITMLGDDVGTVLAHTDYHIVAAGFGGAGAVVRSLGELPDALAEARRAAQAGVPFLVNAIIGKTEFRKGSISM